MIRRKRKKNFIEALNICLLVFVVFSVILFFVINKDKNKVLDNDIQGEVSFYSLVENNKKDTMLEKELIITKKNKTPIKEVKLEIVEDPELSYAISLFESSVNSKLKTVFNKPFNYDNNSSCILEVSMKSNYYKIMDCNSDTIFKREIELGIERMKPFKRKVYNNINLNDKKVKVKLKIN